MRSAEIANENKYIVFEEFPRLTKTRIWDCVNRRSEDAIGAVKWYGPWRQYCFFPMLNSVFNAGCLKTITRFVEAVNREHKE